MVTALAGGVMARNEARVWVLGGERIKRAREAGRWSQAALAEAVGISQGYLSHIERGLRRPQPEVLWRIADLLDVPREELGTYYGYADTGTGDLVFHVPRDRATAVRLLLQLPIAWARRFERMMRVALLEEDQAGERPDRDTGDEGQPKTS